MCNSLLINAIVYTKLLCACEQQYKLAKRPQKCPPIFIKKYYVFNIKIMLNTLQEVPMTTPDMNKMNYVRALIKAGLTRDLVLRITSISSYQYTQIQREVLAA